MRPLTMSVLLPILAAIFVVIWGGAVGLTFILLAKTTLHEWGSVIVGMGVVVGIPVVAVLLSMSLH